MREVAREVAVEGIDPARRQNDKATGPFPVDPVRTEAGDLLRQGMAQIRFRRRGRTGGDIFAEPAQRRTGEDHQKQPHNRSADQNQIAVLDGDGRDRAGDQPGLSQHETGSNAPQHDGQYEKAPSTPGVLQQSRVYRSRDAAARGAARLNPHYRSRSIRCSPTRMALAMAVSAGFTAPMLGKKLVSTT